MAGTNTIGSRLRNIWRKVSSQRVYSEKHMRVAELCISAADSAEVRAIVGATCIGVWKQTGEHTYVLNHIGLSWNPLVPSPTGSACGTWQSRRRSRCPRRSGIHQAVCDLV
jgi:hypothetical protein